MGCCSSKGGADGQYAAGNASRREEAWKRTGIVGLRDAGLRELPRAVLESGARTVDASNNRIAAIPPAIRALANLQRLTLSANDLVEVPRELCECVQLRALVLDRNRIARLPPDAPWANLSKLQTLSLSRNALTELPSGLGALASLTKLAVAGNRLRALPAELASCAKLEEVDASDNDPSAFTVPSSLGRLTKLSALHLDNSGVTEIPTEVLTGCVALVTLNLHGCPIELDRLEETYGYDAFAARVRGKHSKKIAGGAMIGSRGLDDGVDRDTSRESGPHR
jgi:Leucine-rich repeat (LRR) protein